MVHGVDGIDEISLSDETEVADVRPRSVQRYRVTPEDFGVATARREELAGGDAAANAKIIRGILEGERGPQAGFCVHQCGGGAGGRGARREFSRRCAVSGEAIDSGCARAKLEALIEFSRG